MLSKLQVEEVISNELKKVLSNNKIYKYASYDIGLNKIVLEKTLNFSHPSILNDPFDCNEELLKISIDKEAIIKHYNKNKTKIPESNWDAYWEKVNDPKRIKNFNKEKRDRKKISCFSSKHDEVLMWSHYAEKHSGICIGFDFPQKYLDKFILAPVRYINKLKPLDSNTLADSLILYWLTTKSERWKYEEEIRAITNTNTQEKTELIEFEPKFIKEVVFGCNVNQNLIDDGINKIRNNDLDFKNLIIKQMVIDTETFLLKEKLIKPSA